MNMIRLLAVLLILLAVINIMLWDYCIEALAQQVISLQFGDIAGFIFCCMCY